MVATCVFTFLVVGFHFLIVRLIAVLFSRFFDFQFSRFSTLFSSAVNLYCCEFLVLSMFYFDFVF